MTTTKTFIKLLLIIPFFFSLALAHGNKNLANEKKPHGGQAKEKGDYYLELVVEDNSLALYLTDHDWQPSTTQGLTASARILSDGTQSDVTLSHAGENKLVTDESVLVSEDMKVVVRIQLPGENKATLVRFSPEI